MSTDALEKERREFASLAIDTAIRCSDNREFLTQLAGLLPEGFLSLAGTGSTRAAYKTPLGIVIKLQREDIVSDPLRAAELRNRGGDSYLPLLAERRRVANSAEMVAAALNPLLFPRVYGFLASFGIPQIHPSVLIFEEAKSLKKVLPGDLVGIDRSDLRVIDGRLEVYDIRISPKGRPDYYTADPTDDDKDGISLENIGVLPNGQHVLLDGSAFEPVSLIWNYETCSPLEIDPATLVSPEYTLAYSKRMYCWYLTNLIERMKNNA